MVPYPILPPSTWLARDVAGCAIPSSVRPEKTEDPPSPVLTPTAFFQMEAIEFGVGRRGTPA